MAKPNEWFGVKTFYISETNGKPKVRDKYYKKSSVMLEERVVIFRAKNFDSAIKLAEREAKKYAKSKHINPYGENVFCRYIDIFDAYRLYDEPGVNAEVFSSTEIHLKRSDAVKSAKARFGPIHGKVDDKLRLKFRLKQFSKAISA